MSFKTKYKDRTPRETVEIISSFFKKRKYTIKEIYIRRTEADTYSSALALKLGENVVLEACGKGMTEDFCNASAHAELYERFCNMVHFINHKYIIRDLIKHNMNNYGYQLNKNEKILSFEEAMKNIDDFKMLKKFKNKHNYKIKEIYDEICDNQYIGLPFINLNDSNDVNYIEPRIYNQLFDTTGLSAGNTLEEALVQGISEMLERHINVKLFEKQNKELLFYSINSSKIENKELQKKIQILKTQNIDLQIIDLSYTFNLPVLATILIDKNNNKFNINFGCHPIFDIALERTITELYQTSNYHQSINDFCNEPSFVTSQREISNDTALSTKKLLPEYIILNSINKDKYNTNVFLNSNDYSNSNLVNYYKKILIDNNINIYYYNSSLSKDFYAIQLFSKNLLNPKYNQYYNSNISKIDTTLPIIRSLNNTLNLLIEDKKTKILEERLIKSFELIDNYEKLYILSIFEIGNTFLPFGKGILFFYEIIQGYKYNFIKLEHFKGTPFENYIRCYLTYNSFATKYSKPKLKKIEFELNFNKEYKNKTIYYLYLDVYKKIFLSQKETLVTSLTIL